MPNFEIGFVQLNGSVIPDNSIVYARSTDGLNTLVEQSTIGLNTFPGQGTANFVLLSSGIEYNFVFANPIYGPYLLTMPTTATVIAGAQGVTGSNGHGSSTTTSIVTLQGLGQTYNIPVVDSVAFPKFSTLLLTDGINYINVTVNSNANNVVNATSTYESTTVGSTIANGATLTFSGPQGVAGPVGPQGAQGSNANSVYDIAQTFEATSANGPTNIFTSLISRPLSLQQNPPNGGQHQCYTFYNQLTQNVTFNLNKNGTSFGTLIINTGNSVGVFNIPTVTNFAIGDRLTIDFSNSSDGTTVDNLNVNNFIITLCPTLL